MHRRRRRGGPWAAADTRGHSKTAVGRQLLTLFGLGDGLTAPHRRPASARAVCGRGERGLQRAGPHPPRDGRGRGRGAHGARRVRARPEDLGTRDARTPPWGPVADDATEGTNGVTYQDELNNEKRKLVAEKNARASVEAKRGMLFARPDPLLRGVRMPLTPAPSLLSGAAPTSPTNPAPASPPHTHS